MRVCESRCVCEGRCVCMLERYVCSSVRVGDVCVHA